MLFLRTLACAVGNWIFKSAEPALIEVLHSNNNVQVIKVELIKALKQTVPEAEMSMRMSTVW